MSAGEIRGFHHLVKQEGGLRSTAQEVGSSSDQEGTHTEIAAAISRCRFSSSVLLLCTFAVDFFDDPYLLILLSRCCLLLPVLPPRD